MRTGGAILRECRLTIWIGIMISLKESKLGLALVFIASVAWSTAGPFTRLVSTDVAETLFWRGLFGAAFIVLIWMALNQNRPFRDLFYINRCEWIIGSWMGLGTCSFVAAFYFTDIANVAFVYGCVPIVTALLNWIILSNKPTKLTLFTIVLCFFGVLLLSGGNQDFTDFLGIGLSSIMTIVMGSIPVIVRAYPTYDGIKSSYVSAFLISVAMLPFVSSYTLTGLDLFWLPLFGFVTMALGLAAFVVGSSKIHPTTAATLALVEVPLAPIWAVIWFGESMTITLLIGGLLIWTSAIVQIRYGST